MQLLCWSEREISIEPERNTSRCTIISILCFLPLYCLKSCMRIERSIFWSKTISKLFHKFFSKKIFFFQKKFFFRKFFFEKNEIGGKLSGGSKNDVWMRAHIRRNICCSSFKRFGEYPAYNSLSANNNLGENGRFKDHICQKSLGGYL